MLNIPRILIAGTQSGVGKTSVSLGLARALTSKGFKVQTYKVGPDFLDPTYLKLASGRECHNLDGWMMGPEYVLSLFGRTCQNADIAIIEGVMGMYDGIAPGSVEGSSAQIASILKAPVLLVADAGGIAGSFAAMVSGYARFREDVTLAGVIANKTGSANHNQILAMALSHAGLPPLVAGIMKNSLPPLNRRRLGLVTASEEKGMISTLDNLASYIEKAMDLEGIMKAARSAPDLPEASFPQERGGKPKKARLGAPYDKAFHFYYPDNMKNLEDAGLELVSFSPVSDKALPEGLDGLYLGGGYPEEFAEELSSNETMLEDVRRFCDSGKPVYAECGGLIYLSQGMEDVNGTKRPLAGVLPVWTRMLERFKRLGYVEARLAIPSLFGDMGHRLRGHRFHYSELTEEPESYPEWRLAYELERPGNKEKSREGYQNGSILASYAHIHFASTPGSAEKFAGKIMEFKEL